MTLDMRQCVQREYCMEHHSRIVPEQQKQPQLLASEQPGAASCLLTAMYNHILPTASGREVVGDVWHVADNVSRRHWSELSGAQVNLRQNNKGL